METNGLIKSDKIMQKIQLVQGEFTPSEASDVIMSLIDEKINFHHNQRLQKWEQNHKHDSEELEDRIKQLEKEKQKTREFIANAKALKKNILINGILEIAIVENLL
ncbi:hypothetical protein [Flavobacterium geliluteum]|uniref:Uncharacterized protein n=1 Tax=Flavobacterium geliluteum TaxID=2816120 RepID=A0A940X876_9FLAO|nr:hypothetical protein [Flavobacterium geliluteum]MBP4138739.1 hypothetical protein [Flavobacterium geliluteum]